MLRLCSRFCNQLCYRAVKVDQPSKTSFLCNLPEKLWQCRDASLWRGFTSQPGPADCQVSGPPWLHRQENKIRVETLNPTSSLAEIEGSNFLTAKVLSFTPVSPFAPVPGGCSSSQDEGSYNSKLIQFIMYHLKSYPLYRQSRFSANSSGGKRASFHLLLRVSSLQNTLRLLN